jgi:hypothetical protein
MMKEVVKYLAKVYGGSSSAPPRETMEVPNDREGGHPSPKRAKTGEQSEMLGQNLGQLGTCKGGTSGTNKMKGVAEEPPQPYDGVKKYQGERESVAHMMKEVVKYLAKVYAGSSSAPPRETMEVPEIKGSAASDGNLYNSSEDRVQGLSGEHLLDEYEDENLLSDEVHVRNRTLTLIEREDDTRSCVNFLVYFSHNAMPT